MLRKTDTSVLATPFICVALSVLLTACSSVTQVSQPELPESALLQEFTQSPTETWLETQPRWWQAFADTQLNSLITQALAHNYSLKSSLALLQQSEALLQTQRSGHYPTLNLEAGKSRAWGKDSTTDNWSAGLSASYEIDFWGSVAGAAEKAQFELYSTQAATRIQANTLASQLASAWFGYVHEINHLHLLQQQQQRIDAGLKVINARFQRGQAQLSDVWQQQTLAESIVAEQVSAAARRDVYRQQLLLWLSSDSTTSQQALAATQLTLPSIHHGEPLQVSMHALAQRPDVEQAFFNMQAANAGVAIAQTNRYPRLTLSASYLGQAPKLDNVFDNWVATLAGNLVMPLIDGGNRRAQVEAQQALLKARLADYQQTLLAAAQQVQQLLVTQQEQQQLDISLNKQLTLAQKTESFQRSRYRKGVGDYLALLSAQRDVLALERQVLANQLSYNQTRINLFQAVSHGRFMNTAAEHSSLQEKIRNVFFYE